MARRHIARSRFLSRPSVCLFAGTRPEVIKLFPVILALRASQKIDCRFVTLRQQGQLLSDALAAFDLTPDEDFELEARNFELGNVAGAVLLCVTKFLREHPCQLVVVQGDTTTAAMAAYAAFYRQIPVAHVESGLRTGTTEPFPEEVHRTAIDHLASLCFAPTPRSAENLFREGIDPQRISVTGNTAIDAIEWIQKHADPKLPSWLKSGPLVVITCHRRESFGAPVRALCEELLRMSRNHPALQLVIILHPNPQISEPIQAVLKGQSAIKVLPPQPYPDFVSLLSRAWIFISDSGGLQEEAAALGKPILILRSTTERPESLTANGVLVGFDLDQLSREVSNLLSDPELYRARAHQSSGFGDGKAGKKIARAINHFLLDFG